MKADILPGEWFGWADGMNALFLYRVIFTTNGVASLAKDFNGKITVVNLQKAQVGTESLAFVSGYGTSAVLKLTATLVGSRSTFDAVVEGPTWQHEVRFFKENLFRTRLENLQKAQASTD